MASPGAMIRSRSPSPLAIQPAALWAAIALVAATSNFTKLNVARAMAARTMVVMAVVAAVLMGVAAMVAVGTAITMARAMKTMEAVIIRITAVADATRNRRRQAKENPIAANPMPEKAMTPTRGAALIAILKPSRP